jgi:hypothetical protein
MNTLGFQYSLYTKGDYISATNNLCINNFPVINSTSLGPGITNSNLTSLGTIMNLNATSGNIENLAINNATTSKLVITGNDIPIKITQSPETSYGYFPNGATNASLISLKADNSIWTKGSFIVSADTRIKKNITPASTSNALKNILNLPLVNYNYIDTNTNGPDTHIGINGQDVNKIAPQATKTTSGAIPSIYLLASHIEMSGNYILITVVNPVELTVGGKLEIIVDGIGNTIVSIVQYSASSITVSIWNNFDITKSVFVYGPIVDDFVTLNESYIGVLCVGGIQELSNYITNINSSISNVSTTINNIQNEITVNVDDMTQMKAHHDVLENSVQHTNDQFFNITTDFSNQIKETTNHFNYITSEIAKQINANTADVNVLKNYNTLLSNLINKTNNQVSTAISNISNQINSNTTDVNVIKNYNTLLSNVINKTHTQISTMVSQMANQLNTNSAEMSSLKTYNTLLTNLVSKTNDQLKASIQDVNNQINSNTIDVSTLKTYNALLSNLINKTNTQVSSALSAVTHQINCNAHNIKNLKPCTLYLRYNNGPNTLYDATLTPITSYTLGYNYLSWANNKMKDCINFSNCWNNNQFSVKIDGIYNIAISIKSSTSVILFISKGRENHLTDYDTLVISNVSTRVNDIYHTVINTTVNINSNEIIVFGIYCTDAGNIIKNLDVIAPNSYFTITLLHKI